MVQRYDVGYADDIDVEEGGRFVLYEDYVKLSKSVRACVAAIQEGSLTIEHVQGYLEGVIGALDD